MYGVEAPGWRVPSISRPHWLVSAPPQRPTYKNGFNSAKHNNLESGEVYKNFTQKNDTMLIVKILFTNWSRGAWLDLRFSL